MKKGIAQPVIIALVALLAVGVLFVILQQQGIFAQIGDPTGTNNIGVTIYDVSGSTSYKSWTLIEYDECTADIPGFYEYTGGVRVDNCGNDISQGQICPGNTYMFPATVYGTQPGSRSITMNKPRQHKDCVQIIQDFAKSAGVNITTVVYLNNTVTQVIVNDITKYKCGDGTVVAEELDCVGHDKIVTIYANETIYMCDGKPVLDPADCVNQVIVVKEKQSFFASLGEFFNNLWSSIRSIFTQ